MKSDSQEGVVDPLHSLPDVLKRTGTRSGVEYELRVARNLKWFDGHFPGNPILPGIIQIHWAIHFGGSMGFKPGGFKGIQRVKFKEIVRPDTILLLHLKSKPGKLVFSFISGSSLHSEGTIEFSEHSVDSGCN